MVESKFVVFQMIPHTLFIEWDFGHCSLAVLLFMSLFTSRFTVHDTIHCRCEVTIHIYSIVHIYDTIHMYDTIHTTSFFL